MPGYWAVLATSASGKRRLGPGMLVVGGGSQGFDMDCQARNPLEI